MTQPFTTAELDAIQAAAEAATPGPWVANVQYYKNWQTGRKGSHWWITTEQGHTLPMDSAGDKRAEFNAKLIALVSPATVLRLVGQIEWMTKELSREEHSHGETLKRCEYAEEWADKFAYAIAPVEVIGEHSNLNNPWQEAYELLTPQYEVNELKSQVANLVVQAGKADTYHKLLCEVYVQAGNGAGPMKRHCLTPSVRDAIRDVLFPDGGHKSGEQPKTEAK